MMPSLVTAFCRRGSWRFARCGVIVGGEGREYFLEDSISRSGRLNSTEREERPLKVTSAFSDVQLRLVEEKRVRRRDASRVMLKLF